MSADPCGCGCCEVALPAAPVTITNAPGLPAVSYRIGTYLSFREALIEHRADSLALSRLTTRDPADYALAVLDSWAYVADILTFYSERTINEAFVRTAQLRDSVVRLAAMVGYGPSPGMAATAPLAFSSDAASAFTLVAGARIQSTPAPGDTSPPVKFETLADVRLSAVLNAAPLLAPPQPASPLAGGSSGGPLAPGAVLPPGVSTGAALVAWSPGSGALERKRVTALTDAAPAGGLSWAPPLEQDAQQLNVELRTMRLFGCDAPQSGIATSGLTTNSSGKTVVQLSQTTTSYALASSSTIQVDTVYPDISPGDSLLVSSGSENWLVEATVTTVSTAPASTQWPIQTSVTQLELSAPVPAISDVHDVEVTLLGAEIPLWDSTIPSQIDGPTVYAMLSTDQAPLHGQAVALTDASGAAYQTTVVSSAAAPDLPGALAIDLAQAPSPPLDGASAALLGNVVEASQGETVTNELLGTGDATVAGQRFQLGKPPVTYVPHPGSPHGGQSTLSVFIGGVEWEEVEYLYGSGPDAHVFVVEREDDGSYHVRFGDGVVGALVPTGAQVTADYRTGLGSAGNVAADSLRLPLTRPTGLVAVTNPVAAGGGSDPESIEEARANAPNTVRTFERIVSLQDFADQARENALVGKASAGWIMVGSEPGVGLTVAGPAGEVLGADQLAQLQADLDARRDPNRPLWITSYVPIALAIKLRLIAIDPTRKPGDVVAAVQGSLLAHFAFGSMQFGQTVRLSEVFVAAQDTVGVIGVDVDEMTLADPAQLATHLLSAAPIQDRIDLRPSELATLAAADLTVVVA